MSSRKTFLWPLVGLPFLLTWGQGIFGAPAGYPEKPVMLVVPYPPGGRTDLVGRLLGDYLKSYVGQPVVILNKAGAGGVVGAREVAHSKPDGYTLGLFSTGFVVTQYTMPAAPTLEDYQPIAQINFDPAALAVSDDSPYRQLADLVAHSRKNPGKLKVGVTSGASSHLFAAAFARAAGITVSYIPFKGDPESVTALAGGHIDSSVAVPAVFRPLLQDGHVRLLAIAAEKPLAAFERVPTFHAQSVDLAMGTWHGVFAPKGIPQAIVEILEKAIKQVTADPQFLQKMTRLLIGVEFRGHPDFTKFLREEDQWIKQLVKSLGLEVSPKR